MARATCQRCLRPEVVCTCAAITPVDNRTGVVILQHPAERRHPLGTVRFARLGLKNVRRHVHWNVWRGEPTDLALEPGTALLFPGDEAADLRALPISERPHHLLVLDGTWTQARVLMAANPWLKALPRVRVATSRPSRYGDVRPEPSAECVSTVEAIVEAIGALEPELDGLDEMLKALEAMVAHQQMFAATPRPRFKQRQGRAAQPIPTVLRQAPHNVVVAYCEMFLVRDGEGSPRERLLALWAGRLGDADDRLVCRVRPQGPLPSVAHLRQLRLSVDDLATGFSFEEAGAQLRDFLGDEGVLAAWNQRTLESLRPLLGDRSTLMLKGIYCNLRHRGCGHVEEVARQEGLALPNVADTSRGAERLAASLAMADFLSRGAVTRRSV